ncbi:hypothetical protein HK405_012276 [Cladochytrium tenue]|nr:hypothetical protein HK405_012276 [Cladochytrium tenue]
MEQTTEPQQGGDKDGDGGRERGESRRSGDQSGGHDNGNDSSRGRLENPEKDIETRATTTQDDTEEGELLRSPRHDDNSDSESASASGKGGKASDKEDTRRKKKSRKEKSKKSKEEKKKSKKKKSKSSEKAKKKKKEDKKKKSKKSKSRKDDSDGKLGYGSMNATYGSHGIITSTDMYAKEAEFRAWLMEVKKISPDSLNTKQYFSEYMEDFNTGSLPHEKYYNLDQWENQERLRKEWMGASMGGDEDAPFDFKRDEEMLKMQSRSRAGGRVPGHMTFTTNQLQELKRVSEERLTSDRLRKMGFQPKSSAGVRYEDVP